MPTAMAARNATQTGDPKMKRLATEAKVASAKIDAARQHHDGKTGDDDREFAELTSGFDRRQWFEKARDGHPEARHRHRHGQKRNGVVGPALAENFTDQMIGNEIKAPTLQLFAGTHVLCGFPER